MLLRKEENLGSPLESTLDFSKSRDSVAHEHGEEDGNEVESSKYREDWASTEGLTESSLETDDDEHGDVAGVAEQSVGGRLEEGEGQVD